MMLMIYVLKNIALYLLQIYIRYPTKTTTKKHSKNPKIYSKHKNITSY